MLLFIKIYAKSVQRIVHIKEQNPKQPHRYQYVVCRHCNILDILPQFHNQTHSVQNQYADQSGPSHYRMENAIVQEIYAQKGCILIEVPAIP